MAIKDLTGMKFGRLTALKCVGRNYRQRAVWECACKCGITVQASSAILLSGDKISCGCTYSRLGMRKSTEHRSWTSMKSRCSNPKDSCYHNYGGRGIKVCERWKKFANFFADMGRRPSGTTLDRIDVNGNYEPGNCRWATRKEQAENTRKTIFIEIAGERKTIDGWSKQLNISRITIYSRIFHGWDPATAVLTPVKFSRKRIT